jgi:hypothetical protein
MGRKDILYNEEGTFKIVNGDFAIGESDAQHIQDILEFNPGDLKEYPTVGVGVHRQLKGNPGQEFWKKVQKNLEADGYDMNDVEINFNE